MALTHTPHSNSGLLDHPDAPDDSARHRLPKQTRTSAPVLGVTAMAAALGATGFTATAAAAAAPASAAPAVSAPDQADPGLALAARIQQQADGAPGAEDGEDADQLTAGQGAAHQESARQEAARLAAAQEAAAKRAAQQAAATEQAARTEQPAAPAEAAEAVAVAPAEQPAAVSPLPGHTVDAPAATPWEQLRTGVEISAPAHTPVRAITAGAVSSAGWSGRYGYRVIQTLPDGTELWYCQLASISATGGELAQGAVLGQVGATGSRATGPRLHLEVRPGGGAPVDALAWLQAHGVTA
ncbi:M23 family metallopeptidase [Kitasatospora acidiphila]|uniref:M23 family metallopeptidase n=1 Tax=Kitasatospora acidiphila TaxID=2567942 RepID=A0A540W6Q5_9ACTN|nr:M23 family metallopeptidase [Kitasatospora acidiphila]TQF04024.1 M23 family metallopeptidase [Kitasatospora acidiphila]